MRPDGRYIAIYSIESIAMDVARFAAVIDVETTGLSPYYDEIIELSIDLISFDPNSCQPVAITDSYFGQREPSIRISPGAGAVHGLTLDDLRGKRLDHSAITRVISRADFLVAHNAAFDKGFVIQLLPECCSKPWLCTMRDIDWSREGCTHRSLEALLDWLSVSADRLHRAKTDTAAVVALLTRFGMDGRPFFAQLLEKLPERSIQASQTGAGLLQQYLVGRQEGAERNRQWEEKQRCRIARQNEFETRKPAEITGEFLSVPAPSITFAGRTFVFTGTFRHGQKKECGDAVARAGWSSGGHADAADRLLNRRLTWRQGLGSRVLRKQD